MHDVTDEQYEKHYKELKDYLKSTDEDKGNIMAMLKRAHEWVQGRCGEFDLENTRGKDLVFNRVRFDFNGFSDHFESSFMSDISSLSFELWKPEVDPVEETT